MSSSTMCNPLARSAGVFFLAKIRFDTAENEPAKNLQTFCTICQFCYFKAELDARLRPIGLEARARRRRRRGPGGGGLEVRRPKICLLSNFDSKPVRTKKLEF